MTDETPRLHIDSDWKEQAQREKDRLAEKESARDASKAPEGEYPPADFRALVATLASQAMMGLGAYGDPQTGRVVVDIVGAQFAIDLLTVLEEKTKGNLSADEAKELAEILHHLRARFVQIAQLVATQMAREAGTVGAGDPTIAGSIGPGAGAKPKPGSGLIIPD